jgi:hypothetical protein
VWASRRQYSSTAGTGKPSLQAAGALGPGCQHGLLEHSTVVLQARERGLGGYQTSWLVPSVTHRTKEGLGPTYAGMQVSLVFQGEGNRLYSRGLCGALSSCVCLEARLICLVPSMEPGAIQRL